MTDKVQKYLRKLSIKQKLQIDAKLDLIEKYGIKAADVVPLKGKKGMYRLRVGKLIRVIFRFEAQGRVQIIDVDNRDAVY